MRTQPGSPTSEIIEFGRNTPRPGFWSRHRDTLVGYAFVLPFVLIYLLFLIYPFLRGIWISLHDWNLLAVAFDPGAKAFVGLDNYRDMIWGRGMTWGADHLLAVRLLGLAALLPIGWLVRRGSLPRRSGIWLGLALVVLFGVLLGIHPSEDGRWYDRRFWGIVWNTFVFVLLTVPLVTGLALALAMALNKPQREMGVLRTIFFLSQVLSVTVVTLIWQIIYSPNQGIIANVLELFGLPAIEWITNPALAMPSLVITTVWWSLGFAMVIFLAGLQEIPNELYEAARLDGASGWSIFRFITFPALQRTTTLVVVFEIVLHFQIFGQSHLITRGGPNDATQVLVRYVYQTGFRDSELGYASALAIFLFLLMLIFSALQLRLNTAEGN